MEIPITFTDFSQIASCVYMVFAESPSVLTEFCITLTDVPPFQGNIDQPS